MIKSSIFGITPLLISILISYMNICFSFELGLWRGVTNYYIKGNTNINGINKIDLTKPVYSTHNHTNYNMDNYVKYFYYNNSVIFNSFYNSYKYNYYNNNENRFFRFKLKSYDKLGGIVAKIDKKTDNTYYFTNQINFFYNTARSIITINYTYNNNLKMELNSIIVSGLRCGMTKTFRNRTKLINITSLKNKLKTWTYCKSTTIDAKKPFILNEKEINCYEYEFLLKNDNGNRISSVFIDNLVISVPEIIDDNKPFSILLGCLISNDCYKQVNLNYNFNGLLTSVEYNEYEPYNFTSKINNYLNLMKNKLLSLK